MDWAELQKRVRTWQDNEDYGETGQGDLESDIYTLIDRDEKRYWVNIAEEGIRIWNLMFPDLDIESGSPMSLVFYAVATQAADGVWRAVAETQGVDKDDLYDTAARQYERPE